MLCWCAGGRADAERAEQEQQLLRGVDPEQREDCRVRYPSARPEDVGHVHRQQHCHPGAVQARQRAVHGHVPPQGFPPLVSRRASLTLRLLLSAGDCIITCTGR